MKADNDITVHRELIEQVGVVKCEIEKVEGKTRGFILKWRIEL